MAAQILNLAADIFYTLIIVTIIAEGMNLYQKIPNKMRNGCVYPKSIPKLLSSYGIKARYRIGTLNSLKHEVAKGNPVIVMIRYTPGKQWLHYVPVVGYDEDHLFVAESLQEKVNSSEPEYNRMISMEEFKKLWNTSMLKMPLYTHTYFSIDKK